MASVSDNFVTELDVLNPSGVVDLYELRYVDDAGDNLELYFTTTVSNILSGSTSAPPGTNEFYFVGATGNVHYPIRWGNQVYTPIPMKLTQVSVDGNSKLPRPILSISNTLGIVSNLLVNHRNLIGAQLVRKRTYARFLDELDSSGETVVAGNTTDHFPPDVFIIERKNSENRAIVEFELATPMDLENTMLPARVIQSSTCPAQYRGHSCGYAGPPRQRKDDFIEFDDDLLTNQGEWQTGQSYAVNDWVFVEVSWWGFSRAYVCTTAHTSSADDKPPNTSFWDEDECDHKIRGCRLRFEFDPGGLRFMGFPGTSRFQF